MKLKCYGKYCIDNNIKHDKSELIKYHGKNYCETCLNIKMQEDSEKEQFYRCLRGVYHTFNLPGIVYSQIKKNLKDHMTYLGMYNTIQYLQDKKGYVFENKYGIGLVKEYYYEGHNYKKENKKWHVENGNKVIHAKVNDVVGSPVKKIDEGSLLDD